MNKIFFILIVLIWAPQIQAVRFQPIVQPIGMAEKIVVRGFKGRLQIVPTETETLKIEAETKGDPQGWTFTARNVQNHWEILVKGSSEQEDFEQLREGKNLPHFDIKVTAPQRPMEVYWNEGDVMVENWQSDLSTQVTKGTFLSRKGKGRYKVQMIDGTVDFAEHQGAIDVQTFKGKLKLVKTKGDLTINNHSASLLLSEHEGPIRIQNHSGSARLTDVKGRARVKNIAGVFRLTKYSGNFDGDFEKGSLVANFESLQSFKVNSEEAAVTLNAPKDSGALVSLRSEKGNLWGPPTLRKVKRGRWTEKKGRLRGEEQGNIKIISKYGDIVLK